MQHKLAMAALAAVGCAAASASAQIVVLDETFNDGAASSRWSVISQQEGVVGPDGSVDFAFDYSTLGIANPNGGGDTIGAFLQFNKNDDGPVNEGESYAIIRDTFSVAGSFRLDVDMFVYNDGGGGTTEHGMVGVFVDNTNPVSPYEFGTEGGPLAWAYSGEGGDGTGDLGRFAEGGPTSTGYVALGDYAAQATLPPGFDAATGPASTNPRGAWVDVSVVSDGTTISWLLNGAVVDTYDNSGGFYTAGNILVGGMDVFNSSNGNNGVIVDNITVTLTAIPEPTTALATTLAGGLLLLRRRGR